RPRALSSRPMLAAVMPFPREEVTPPVTKTYFATVRSSGGFSNAIEVDPRRQPDSAGSPTSIARWRDTDEVIHGVRRRRHEAPGSAPVRGGRGRPRGHRANRPARAAGAVGRVQPGPAAGRRHGSRPTERRRARAWRGGTPAPRPSRV